jgi:hypothetical protein
MAPGLREVVDGRADIACDLAKKGGRDVAAGVKGDRFRPPIGVAELLVRAALTGFGKALRFEQGDDLPGFKDWQVGHASGDLDGAHVDEF